MLRGGGRLSFKKHRSVRRKSQQLPRNKKRADKKKVVVHRMPPVCAPPVSANVIDLWEIQQTRMQEKAQVDMMVRTILDRLNGR